MNEREIFFNILNREIDNILSGNPLLLSFSGSIKRWVRGYIEPYLNYFIKEGKVEADIATAFIEEEISNKIKSFRSKFEEARNNDKN